MADKLFGAVGVVHTKLTPVVGEPKLLQRACEVLASGHHMWAPTVPDQRDRYRHLPRIPPKIADRRASFLDNPPVQTVAHHPAIAAALSSLRLADNHASEQKRSFTVARTQALLQLRSIPPPDPWYWTLSLLRAANILSDAATVYVHTRDAGREQLTELRFRVPARTDASGRKQVGLASLELRGILQFALENPDAPPVNAPPHTPLDRVRMLLATAVNSGLAGSMRALELCTAGAGVRFERRESTPEGQDPYRECGTSARSPGGQFYLRIWSPKPTFGKRFAKWISLQPSVSDHLQDLWQRSVVGMARGQSLGAGLSLAGNMPEPAITLGAHATWYVGQRAEDSGELWLVRDRVRVLSLAQAAAASGQPATMFFGEVECASLRLTADLRDVVRDGAYDLLIAWILDAHAHLFGDDLSGVHWPTELQSVPTASGRPVPIDTLKRRMRRGQDLLFVWPYQQRNVPRDLRARVYCLWPSERELLHRALPGLHTVPLRALGGKPQFERVDLQNLAARSLPPQNIPLAPDLSTYKLPGGQSADLELQAYLHRTPTDVAGLILLVAHGRRVAHLRDHPSVLAGVTLVGYLTGKGANESDVDLQALRQQTDLTHALFERLSRAAHEHLEQLLAAAFTTADPRAIPLVRDREAALDPWTIGLRFSVEVSSTQPQLQLTWRPSPLLQLEVGAARLGARTSSFYPKTIADALTYASRHGGLWSSEPAQTRVATHETHPWHLNDRGKSLLARLLGSGLWPKTAEPQAYLRPLPVDQQTHLLRPAGTCKNLSEQTHEAWARRVLLGHLLVASALGEPTFELEHVPLFSRYDPRALQPSRLVSLSQLLAERERTPLVPEGAVSRELAYQVLEVTLGEANILYTHFGFPLAGIAASRPGKTAETPALDPVLRRRGRSPAPLVSFPLADEMAAGALRIDVDLKPAEIALWSNGLHIDNLRLQHPLDCIGGRLWLTKHGMRNIRAIGQRVFDLSRGVVRVALDSQLLYEPGSAEHRAVVSFLGRCYAAAQRGEAELIADILPAQSPTPPRTTHLAHTLNKHPLLRLPRDPRPRLLGLLRQTLMMPIRLETALLSWSLVRSMEGPDSGGLWTIELGRRNRIVAEALAGESPQDGFFATAMILAEVVPRLIAAEVCPRAMLTTAYYRLLALGFAHI